MSPKNLIKVSFSLSADIPFLRLFTHDTSCYSVSDGDCIDINFSEVVNSDILKFKNQKYFLNFLLLNFDKNLQYFRVFDDINAYVNKAYATQCYISEKNFNDNINEILKNLFGSERLEIIVYEEPLKIDNSSFFNDCTLFTSSSKGEFNLISEQMNSSGELISSDTSEDSKTDEFKFIQSQIIKTNKPRNYQINENELKNKILAKESRNQNSFNNKDFYISRRKLNKFIKRLSNLDNEKISRDEFISLIEKYINIQNFNTQDNLITTDNSTSSSNLKTDNQKTNNGITKARTKTSSQLSFKTDVSNLSKNNKLEVDTQNTNTLKTNPSNYSDNLKDSEKFKTLDNLKDSNLKKEYLSDSDKLAKNEITLPQSKEQNIYENFDDLNSQNTDLQTNQTQTEFILQNNSNLVNNVFDAFDKDGEFEVKSCDELLSSNQFLIDNIEQLLPLDDESFKSLIMPLFNSLANYIYYLPASESYHHEEEGGLFRHSLECGLLSLKILGREKPRLSGTPKERIISRKIYALITLIGGLLHDVGKVLTDVEVYGLKTQTKLDEPKSYPNNNEIIIWKPTQNGLFSFLDEANFSKYSFRYCHNRGKRHETFCQIMINTVLPKHLVEYLLEYPNLLEELYCALNNQKDSFLYSIIKKADMKSVELDLGRRNLPDTAYKRKPNGLAKAILKLQDEIRTSVNSFNNPKGIIFIVGEKSYLSLNSFKFFEIMEPLKKAGISLPFNDNISFYQVLIDLGIAKYANKAEGLILTSFYAVMSDAVMEVYGVELLKTDYLYQGVITPSSLPIIDANLEAAYKALSSKDKRIISKKECFEYIQNNLLQEKGYSSALPIYNNLGSNNDNRETENHILTQMQTNEQREIDASVLDRTNMIANVTSSSNLDYAQNMVNHNSSEQNIKKSNEVSSSYEVKSTFVGQSKTDDFVIAEKPKQNHLQNDRILKAVLAEQKKFEELKSEEARLSFEGNASRESIPKKFVPRDEKGRFIKKEKLNENKNENENENNYSSDEIKLKAVSNDKKEETNIKTVVSANDIVTSRDVQDLSSVVNKSYIKASTCVDASSGTLSPSGFCSSSSSSTFSDSLKREGSDSLSFDKGDVAGVLADTNIDKNKVNKDNKDNIDSKNDNECKKRINQTDRILKQKDQITENNKTPPKFLSSQLAARLDNRKPYKRSNKKIKKQPKRIDKK